MIERGDRIGWDRARSAACSRSFAVKKCRIRQGGASSTLTLILTLARSQRLALSLSPVLPLYRPYRLYLLYLLYLLYVSVRFGYFLGRFVTVGDWVGGYIRFVAGFYFLVRLVVFITFVFFSCRNKFIFYFRYVHTHTHKHTYSLSQIASLSFPSLCTFMPFVSNFGHISHCALAQDPRPRPCLRPSCNEHYIQLIVYLQIGL